MKAMVLAETEGAARELCAGIRPLVDEVVYVTFGDALTGIADKVCVVDVPVGHMKEDAVDSFHAIFRSEQPEIVISESTRRLRVIVGRMAAREHASVIADVTAFGDGMTESMYFGGVGIKKAKNVSATAFCTVAAGTFDIEGATGTDIVEHVDFIEPARCCRCMVCEPLPPADVDLTKAARVVAAGRGFAVEEDLQMARDLCAKIGGELGCTRPLTESEKWFPREAYIGVSGLILKPDVYMGIGVSGQMQHMVGVSRARLVFAINKDAHAPIFNQADYGLVGDLKTVLPQILEKL